MPFQSRKPLIRSTLFLVKYQLKCQYDIFIVNILLKWYFKIHVIPKIWQSHLEYLNKKMTHIHFGMSFVRLTSGIWRALYVKIMLNLNFLNYEQFSFCTKKWKFGKL